MEWLLANQNDKYLTATQQFSSPIFIIQKMTFTANPWLEHESILYELFSPVSQGCKYLSVRAPFFFLKYTY